MLYHKVVRLPVDDQNPCLSTGRQRAPHGYYSVRNTFLALSMADPTSSGSSTRTEMQPAWCNLGLHKGIVERSFCSAKDRHVRPRCKSNSCLYFQSSHQHLDNAGQKWLRTSGQGKEVYFSSPLTQDNSRCMVVGLLGLVVMMKPSCTFGLVPLPGNILCG